jgi:phosphohistidine phosphatase SixA
MRTVALCLVAASAALLLTVHPAHADEAAVKALAQGGHAILMRHARISGHAKALVLDPKGNCANEENLSDEGRAQAQRMKAMLDKAGVKFEAVLASPFCRTRDTAQLAFGQPTVEPNLTALELGTQEQAQARTKAMTALLARHAGKGSVALVTHRPNIDALTMEIVEEGEAIVARIQPSGEFDIVGRIKP